MYRLTKRQAWDYAFGMLKVDGLSPSDELRQLAELEIGGVISLDDIDKRLTAKYKKSSDGNKIETSQNI